MRPEIVLRPYVRSDQRALAALFMDAEVMRYVGDGRPLEASAAAGMMKKILSLYESDPSFFIWAVQEGEEYAGHAELKRRKGRTEYELIYILQRSRWGRSLGGCVVDRLLDEAQKRLIPFVIATVEPDNAASLAILRRRGFLPSAELSAELGCPAFRLVLDPARTP